MADVARLDKYANWLIQNKDKKGTPDFDKVANAYRTLRSQDTTPANDNTEADTSMGGALKYGVDNAGITAGNAMVSASELGADYLPESITGYVETKGNEFIDRNTQEIEEANYQRPDGADGIMSNLREGDLANAGKSLVYGAAENLPPVGVGALASLGVGLASTTAPITGSLLILGGTAYGTLNALGETRRENAEKGIDETATLQDLGAAIQSGLIELIPSKGGFVVKMLKEGIQEMGQEATIMGNTAIKGGEYITEEVVNRLGDAGLIGTAISGAANTAISTVSKTGEVVFKPRQELAPEVDQAAGDVSRMIKEISEDSGYNLKDIDPSSQKGANQTLISVRKEIQKEVNAASKQINKQIVKDLDPESIEKFKRIVSTSNLKVGGSVTPADIQFVKDMAGSTEVGQKMVNGLYKSNVLTELYASGLKGGFSKFTDVFNPINNVGKGYNPARDVAGMLNFGAIAGTGGTSLATQIPLVAGGRAIDAVTGRRSKVNRFVKKNTKKSGLATPVGTSLPLNKAEEAKAVNNAKIAAAKAERAKDQAAQNVVKYNEGYAPNYGDLRLNQKADPRGTVHNALAQEASLEGMSIREIDAEIQRIIDARLADKRTSKAEKKSLRTYANFNSLGAMPKGDQTLSLAIAAIRDRFSFPESNPTSPTPPAPQQRSPEVQQGIIGNLQKLSELRASMESDMSISNRDKAVMDKALSDLAKDLGSDPQAMIKQIIKDAKADMDQPTKTDRYLKPYLTRVSIQQKKRK